MVRLPSFSSESAKYHINVLKKLRRRTERNLSRQERIDVLRVYFTLISENHLTAVARTATLLGRCRKVVYAIVNEWKNAYYNPFVGSQRFDEAVRPKGNHGNTVSKPTTVPNSPAMRMIIRDYIREKRVKHERVTATQVTNFLIDSGYIVREWSENTVINRKNWLSALRSVQRYLRQKGFARGRKARSVSMGYKYVAWRNRYVRTIMKNRALPEKNRMLEVYLDESYIHHHYSRSEYSLFDPTDAIYEEPRKPHKGRRYCFCSAIEHNSSAKKTRIIPESTWIFCPQQRSAHHGDYHKNFDGNNFVQWFKDKLLPNLSGPSLIILDNASYHKTKANTVPKPSKMRKMEIIGKLKELGVPIAEDVSAVEARFALRQYIYDNIKPEISYIAEDHGHKIIWTPPYYCELQPIELVWAEVKGQVGRLYSNETTLEDVKARLLDQFKRLESENGRALLQRIVEHSGKFLFKYFDETREDDNEQDSRGETTSSESSISSVESTDSN